RVSGESMGGLLGMGCIQCFLQLLCHGFELVLPRKLHHALGKPSHRFRQRPESIRSIK
ncbi:MAG: hypothetical protein RL081_1749, partial [Pseudomonadota bacterium]